MQKNISRTVFKPWIASLALLIVLLGHQYFFVRVAFSEPADVATAPAPELSAVVAATSTPMGLKRYGVLKGRVVASRREDDLDTPRYQIQASAAGAEYRIAVDVRSSLNPPDLLFLVDDDFRHPVTQKLQALEMGFTAIAKRPDSGALDYLRGNLFNHLDMRLLPHSVPGQDNDLNDRLAYYVDRAMREPGAIIYAFGERWGPEPNKRDKIFQFVPGNGVTDIHMNQGNDSNGRSDDGVWQDGGLIFHFPATDQWVAIFLAFQSQAWHTDDTTGKSLEAPVTAPSAFPAFPWPPPAASAVQILPDARLHLVPELSLGQVAEWIEEALDRNGYSDRSYLAVPNGFALVTRLERINDDGTSASEAMRWPVEIDSPDFVLAKFIRLLSGAPPGRYRLIVFIVTSEPVAPSAQPPSYDQMLSYLSGGADRLNLGLRSLRFTPEHRCTALIYEFERRPLSSQAHLLRPGRLLGRSHLDRAGLWQILANVR